jgi:hypothetical protein
MFTIAQNRFFRGYLFVRQLLAPAHSWRKCGVEFRENAKSVDSSS